MAAARLTFIPDILEEHLEELAFLWEQRASAVRSPSYALPAFLHLEGRIEAHVQGILVGGEGAVPMLKEGLVAEDSTISFAAAYSLLRLGTPVAASVVSEAFRQAQDEQLDGIRQALCHGPIELLSKDLRQASTSAPTPLAAAAFEVLAIHFRAPPEKARLEQLLQDENPEVRQAAWRICAQCEFSPGQQYFDSALAGKEARVRREALYAAAWTRQKWLLPYCRSLVGKATIENSDAMFLLGALGRPEDLPGVLGVFHRTELGGNRFQAPGAFGHPESINELLRAIAGADARSAVAAARAFTKITGCDIESGERIQLPPEDGRAPDEFEKEFLDEAKRPDVQSAQEYWAKAKPKLSIATRICRGFDISKGTTPDILDSLDMESRWEVCLRGKFEGTWHGSPFDLERFPQPATTVPGSK